MTWYIRPRQDFSLSRFAKICMAMDGLGYYHRIVTLTSMKTGSKEVVIRPDCSMDFADAILAAICKNTDCTLDNFRIIEVDE